MKMLLLPIEQTNDTSKMTFFEIWFETNATNKISLFKKNQWEN